MKILLERTSTGAKLLRNGLENATFATRQLETASLEEMLAGIGGVQRVPLYWMKFGWSQRVEGLSSDDVFQEISARYKAVEPEQWLQRHPEAGSSWSSRPRSSWRGLRAYPSHGLSGNPTPYT